MEFLNIDQEVMIKFGISLFFGFAGMFSHFMKRKIKGETITDVMNYFKGNFKYTIGAITATIGAVFILFDPSMPLKALIIASAAAGYSSDSAINVDGGNKKNG